MNEPLAARGAYSGYGKNPVLKDVSFGVPEGQISLLVGPNGSGKSTLLRLMARILKATAGAALLDGRDIATLPTKLVARRVGLLPQTPTAPGNLTVVDLVEQGRFPHIGAFGRVTKADRQAVSWAVEVTRLEAFADRPLSELSGGERQRAWIAMSLAQQTQILLLDEPTTFLDLRHQLEILDLVSQLNREYGLTVLAVVHELNHAMRIGHRVAVMSDGRIEVEGSPDAVITPAVIERVFGVRAAVVDHGQSGRKVVVPYDTIDAAPSDAPIVHRSCPRRSGEGSP